MSKSKTSKPKYAPNRNVAKTANHSSAKPVKPLSANEAKRRIKALKASSEHTT